MRKGATKRLALRDFHFCPEQAVLCAETSGPPPALHCGCDSLRLFHLYAFSFRRGAHVALRTCLRPCRRHWPSGVINEQNTGDAAARVLDIAAFCSGIGRRHRLRAANDWRLLGAVQNSSNTSVIWKVNGITGGNSAVGTISSSGVYRAPSSVPNPALVAVGATAAADQTKTANASVTISRK